MGFLTPSNTTHGRMGLRLCQYGLYSNILLSLFVSISFNLFQSQTRSRQLSGGYYATLAGTRDTHMPFLVGTCGTIGVVVQPSKTLSIYHRHLSMSSASQVPNPVACSPAAKAGIFAMCLVKCEPFSVDPLIARTHVFTQSTLFKFVIDHVVGMRVLVETWQW